MRAPHVSVEDGKLLQLVRDGLPLVERPFAAVAEQVGLAENEVIGRLAALTEARILRGIRAVIDARAVGYRSSLVAMRLPAAAEARAAETVGRHPGVTHVYGRNHAFNLWFTLAVPPASRLGLEGTVDRLDREARAEATLLLPALEIFKIGNETGAAGSPPPAGPPTPEQTALLREIQEELPLVPTPYTSLAARLGRPLPEVLEQAAQMVRAGQLRRIAGVFHARAAGFRANAMGVWAVPDDRVAEVGRALAAHPAASHVYRRPVYPDWPYALFTMVHGRTAAEAESALEAMAAATGIVEYRALFNTQEYKRARLTWFAPAVLAWEERASPAEAPAEAAERAAHEAEPASPV